MTEPQITPAATDAGSYMSRVAAALTAIAADIDDERITSGDCAGLRRGWQEGAGPAFWRLAVRRLEPRGLVESAREERRWLVLVAGLVETKKLPRRGQGFGSAAAAAGVTEHRLFRLLRSRDVESTMRHLRAAVTQIARSGQGFDWRDVAYLLLFLPDNDRATRKIARDYYRVLGAPSDQKSTSQ